MSARSLLNPDATATILKHWGPGPHPGTGTPQSIHAPGGGLNPEAVDPIFRERLAPLIAEFGAPPEFAFEAGVSPVAYQWFNDIYSKLKDDEDLKAKFGDQLDEWWELRRGIEEENERDLYIRLAKGDISIEEATTLGLSEYNQEIRDIGDLPSVVYHATTDTASVLEHGLKARDELGQDRGLGLGGGTANTISFTDSEETAMGILRGMRERHAVLNDPATELPRLIKEAKADGWWDNKMDVKWGTGEPSATAETLSQGGVAGLISGEATYVASNGQKTVEELRSYFTETDYYNRKYDIDTIELVTPKDPKNMWEKAIFKVRYTPQGHAEAIGDFMDEYALFRESAGGPMDPLFISNDDYAFKNKKLSDFSVIKGKTRPGTRGYKLSSMSEWRTWTGEVLESMEVIK